jgi:hypothetical protein
MVDYIPAMARSMISVHGGGAAPAAKRAARNVRCSGTTEKADEWDAIASAIEAIQKAAQRPTAQRC